MTSRTAMGAAALLALAAAAMGTTAAPARADTPRNLTVSGEVRAQLLRAGAAHKGMPVSDFVGLAAGLTYYAYDPDTRTHWAGARLVPAADATQAQVADQDAGSYLLFEQSPAGVWAALNDGTAHDFTCPAPLPESIVALWQWDAEHCRPAPTH